MHIHPSHSRVNAARVPHGVLPVCGCEHPSSPSRRLMSCCWLVWFGCLFGYGLHRGVGGAARATSLELASTERGYVSFCLYVCVCVCVCVCEGARGGGGGCCQLPAFNSEVVVVRIEACRRG